MARRRAFGLPIVVAISPRNPSAEPGEAQDAVDLETDPNTPLRSSLLTGEAPEGFLADARSVRICGWRTLAGRARGGGLTQTMYAALESLKVPEHLSISAQRNETSCP
jgi:hypothetical protein